MKNKTKRIISGFLAVTLCVMLNINPLGIIIKEVLNTELANKLGIFGQNVLYVLSNDISTVLAEDPPAPDPDPVPDPVPGGDTTVTCDCDFDDTGIIKAIEAAEESVGTKIETAEDTISSGIDDVNKTLEAINKNIDKYGQMLHGDLQAILEQLKLISHQYKVAYVHSVNQLDQGCLWYPTTDDVPYLELLPYALENYAAVDWTYWNTGIDETNKKIYSTGTTTDGITWYQGRFGVPDVPKNETKFIRALQVLGYDAIVRAEGYVVSNGTASYNHIYMPEENVTWSDVVQIMYKALGQEEYTYSYSVEPDYRFGSYDENKNWVPNENSINTPLVKDFSNVEFLDFEHGKFNLFISRSNPITDVKVDSTTNKVEYVVKDVYWNKAIADKLVSPSKKNQPISGKDFIALVTDMMHLYGEPVMNQDEIDSLIQVYGTGYPIQLGVDLADDWAYLKVRGVLNDDIEFTGMISREVLLNVGMCVKDPASRSDYKTVQFVLNIDKDMQSEGYYPVNDLNFTMDGFNVTTEIDYENCAYYDYFLAKSQNPINAQGIAPYFGEEKQEIHDFYVYDMATNAVMDNTECEYYVDGMGNEFYHFRVPKEFSSQNRTIIIRPLIPDGYTTKLEEFWIEPANQGGGVYTTYSQEAGKNVLKVSKTKYRTFSEMNTDQEWYQFVDWRNSRQTEPSKTSYSGEKTILELVSTFWNKWTAPMVVQARPVSPEDASPDDGAVCIRYTLMKGEGLIGDQADAAKYEGTTFDRKNNDNIADLYVAMLYRMWQFDKATGYFSNAWNYNNDGNIHEKVDPGRDIVNLIEAWISVNSYAEPWTSSNCVSVGNTLFDFGKYDWSSANSSKWQITNILYSAPLTSNMFKKGSSNNGINDNTAMQNAMEGVQYTIDPNIPEYVYKDLNGYSLIKSDANQYDSYDSYDFINEAAAVLYNMGILSADITDGSCNVKMRDDAYLRAAMISRWFDMGVIGNGKVTNVWYDYNYGTTNPTYVINCTNKDASEEICAAIGEISANPSVINKKASDYGGELINTDNTLGGDISTSMADSAVMNRNENILLSWTDLIDAGVMVNTFRSGKPEPVNGIYYLQSFQGLIKVNDNAKTILIGTTYYNLSNTDSSGKVTGPRLVWVDPDTGETYFDYRCVMGLSSLGISVDEDAAIVTAQEDSLGVGNSVVYKINKNGISSGLMDTKKYNMYQYPLIDEDPIKLYRIYSTAYDGDDLKTVQTVGTPEKYWGDAQQSSMTRISLSSFNPTANYLVVIRQDGEDWRNPHAGLFVWFPKVAFEGSTNYNTYHKGDYNDTLHTGAKTYSGEFGNLSSYLETLGITSSDKWYDKMTLEAAYYLWQYTNGGMVLSADYCLRYFDITDNTAVSTESYNGDKVLGNVPGIVYWLDGIGYVYNVPNKSEYSHEKYLTGQYMLPYYFDPDKNKIINTNVDYYGELKLDDTKSYNGYGYCIGRDGIYNIFDLNNGNNNDGLVQIGKDTMPYWGPSNTKQLPYSPESVIYAPAGYYYMFGGGDAEYITGNKLQGNITTINKVYLGTQRLEYDKIDSNSEPLYFRGHKNLQSLSLPGDTKFYLVYKGGVEGDVLVSATSMLLPVAAGRSLQVDITNYYTNDFRNWTDSIGLTSIIDAIDEGTSFIILFAFKVLPFVGICLMTILVGFAVMSDVKIVRIICEKVIDPVKILTVGRKDINTWTWSPKTVIPLIVLYLSFGLVLNGNIIRLTQWVMQIYGEFNMWFRNIF